MPERVQPRGGQWRRGARAQRDARDRRGKRAVDHCDHPGRRDELMDEGVRGRRILGHRERPGDAVLVVGPAAREVRLEARLDLEVRVPDPVHRRDPQGVLEVHLVEPDERRDAHEQGYRQEREREHGELGGEPGRAADEPERDHRGRQDRQEQPRPAERLVPAHRAGGEEAPVLGREDLEGARVVEVPLGRRASGAGGRR